MAGGKAFGEQNPTQGETAVSWQTWSDGDGGIPNVVGNADWGKLSLQLAGAEGRSAVYDLGSATNRKFTLTENRYGTGAEDAVLEIRGDTVSFLQDDTTPDWEIYTAPITRGWRYVQTRERTFDVYYVDATTGSDSDSGLTPDLAWQTIAKVNASSFSPGDYVLFKRGETWVGRLIPPSSGANGLPITFGAYGSGAKPIIDGNGLNQAIYITNPYLRFENLWAYRSTGANNPTVRVTLTHDIYFYQCDFSNSAAGCGFASSSPTGVEIYNLTFDQCTFFSNFLSGLYIGTTTSGSGGSPGINNVLITDCTAYSNGTNDAADHGFYVQHGATVRRCISYSNASAGIKINANGTLISPYIAVIENNKCYSNHYGILIYDPGTEVTNNICYSNGHSIRLLATESINCLIYHNTLVNGTSEGITISTSADAIGNTFKNNIICQDSAVVPGKLCMVSDSIANIAANNTWDNNLYYIDGNAATNIAASTTFAQWKALTGSPDPNGMHDNPDFVTPYTDLHLQSSSPCRNAGADLDIATDYDGVARDDTPDIGALEYVADKYYFVDATTGSDSDDGLSWANAWQTIAKVNAATFTPGDMILFKRGETWREQLEIRSDGSVGLPIVIGAYGTGNAPIINGADIIATWSDQGSNIWSASVVAEPYCLFFVDGDGTIHWGKRETALVNVDAEYDYYWSGGTVSVYAASDPDTRYATVEGSQRNYCIRDFTSGVTDYITIDGIECKFGKIAGIRQIFYDTGWTVINNTCHHHGRYDESNGHGAYLMGTDITVRGNTFYENGQHGLFIYSNAGAIMNNILIEQNIAYDNWHSQYDVQAFAYSITNIVVRNNLAYFTNANIPSGTESFYFSGLDNSTKYIDGLDLYNNIARATKGIGIYLDSYLRNVDVLHNTVYNGSSEAIYINDDITTATMVIRNNILTTTGTEPALYLDNSTNKTVNNNCYLTVSGKYATIDATLYTVWATYQGAGYEANGVNSDPVVVSSTDMHLQVTSPCRNAGADLDVATDYDGVARDDTPDIGAYEYVA